ncbi:RHS repeat-associated core domain-containing protein [Pirellulaceae bacterium SH467]
MNPLFRNTSSVDALGAVTSTNFDVFGNVTSVVDPLNNTTSYTYNMLQQLVTENKGTDRSFSYDANGNLATLTDRNSRVTTYTYDNRNRLTNESWGGTRTLGYTYDSIDRLTAISDSDSLALDFSFAYDSRSQLQGEVQSGSSYLLGKSFAFDRDYDNVGNQTKLASIIGGALSGTDITGGIKDFANTYTYDYLNRRNTATQSQVSGGNSVAAKHVTTAFNLASQITDVRRYSDTTNSSANLEAHTRHSFDSAGRLKSITHSKTELGAGVNWDGTSSLPSTGTFAAYFLSYDADNRITSLASRADGFVTNFTYDAFDQRTAKRVDTDGNGTWDRYEVYTWADGQEVQRWVDTDGAGTGQKLRLANRYLWAESVDQLLSDEQYASGTGMEIDVTTASGTAGTTLWALTDHLGSVRDLLDNNGVVREHNVFDSFGRLIREVDYNSSGTAISSTDAAAVDSIFGYTGRDWDSDIGMQYNRARWYDPQTGRWLSQDPIGFAAGDANLYRYVGNGPTSATDPSGLAETWWDWMFGESDPPSTPPGTSPFGSHGSIHLDDSYFNSDSYRTVGMVPRPIPTQVCHGMSGLGRVGPVNSFKFSDPRKIEQYIIFAEFIANIALLAAPEVGIVRSALQARSVLTVYRVEGLANTRVILGTRGEVAIQGEQTLFLNFGSRARAEEFLAKRVQQGMDGASVKQFKVSRKFLDELRASAVPESMAKQFPGRPIIVDPTKACDQFGLRPEQIEQLRGFIKSGSGKVGF